MADKLDEQISALMDDECAAQEIELVLRQLIRNAELQGCWTRYHLISDVLRGNAPPAVDSGFSTQLQAAIDGEPPLVGYRSRTGSWYKPLAGLALAASVAAVAVLALRTDGTHAGVGTLPGAVQQSVVDVAKATTRPNPTRADQADARLNMYLVDHNSYASLNSVYGVLPYVRMATYQTGR